MLVCELRSIAVVIDGLMLVGKLLILLWLGVPASSYGMFRSSLLGSWYTRCLLAADPCLVRGRFVGDLLKYFDSLSVLCCGHAQLPVYESTQSMGSAAHSGVVLT